MTAARLQQLYVIGTVAAALACFCIWFRMGAPVSAIGGSLLIAFGYAIVLGVEFILIARFSRDRGALQSGGPQATPPFARELFRAWCEEIVWSPRVFFWRQPFREYRWSDFLAPSAANAAVPHAGRATPVVFVHGFFCNRGFWNPWLRVLHERRIPFAAVSLNPPFSSIDGYTAQLDAAIAKVEGATGLRPLVVGHSMGGLVIRAWLAATAGHRRISGVVTIATPHAGTRMAHFSPAPNAAQMQRGSAWLDALERRENSTEAGPSTEGLSWICYYSNCDNIVFPASSATLEWADNRQLPATPHVRMAFHPQVMAEVFEMLEGGKPNSSPAVAA